MRDWYDWEAWGEGGYRLPRFGPDGEENSTAHIDRERVRAVVVKRRPDGRVLFVQHVDPSKGERLIAFARVYVTCGKGEFRVFVVGWQRTVGGRNVKVLNYILPDGTVHSSSNDDLPAINLIGLMAVNRPKEDKLCQSA